MVVEASNWFGGFSAVTSLVLAVISVVVAALAALFSYRAVHVAHGDAVSFASGQQWEILVQSSSFWTVYGVTQDLPQPMGDPRAPACSGVAPFCATCG